MPCCCCGWPSPSGAASSAGGRPPTAPPGRPGAGPARRSPPTRPGLRLVVVADWALASWAERDRGNVIAAGAGLLVVLLLASLAWPPPYHRRIDGGSSLDIAALYLPALSGIQRVAVFANDPIQAL